MAGNWETADLSNMSQAELKALVETHVRKHGPPIDCYDGEKNSLFAWTDDGKGVWVLPASRTNFERFEAVAKSHPGLGQCELMRLADAKFFAHWRDSERARRARRQEEEDSGIR